MQASCRPMHSSWTGTNTRMAATNKPPIASSSSWPKPAGVSTLQVHKNSQGNGLIPAKARPAHLPPLKANSIVSPQGSRHEHNSKPAKITKRMSESSIKWAGMRTKITILHKDTNGDHNHKRKLVIQGSSDKAASEASSRSPSKFTSRDISRRNSVLIVNDKDADSFDRLRRVYLNQGNRKRRIQKLKQDVMTYQESTVEKEMEDAKRDYEKKVKRDQLNRLELRRVREKHFRLKQSRLRNSYVTLAAMEAPEVSRLAYGLPHQGEEFTGGVDIKKAERKIKDKWKGAMKKVTVVDRLLHAALKDQPTLPEIKIRRTSLANRTGSIVKKEEDKTAGPQLPCNPEETHPNFDIISEPKLPDYFKKLNIQEAASLLKDINTTPSPEPSELDSDEDALTEEDDDP